MMKAYTLGFIFDPTYSKVLLMHKNRPEWQKGKVNGVGGKIEEGETSAACMVREVREETGLATRESDWMLVGTIKGQDYFCDVYGLIHASDMGEAVTATDEAVEWFYVNNLPSHVVSNLTWLVPITIDKLRSNLPGLFTARY